MQYSYIEAQALSKYRTCARLYFTLKYSKYSTVCNTKAQLSIRKADRTVYVQSPASDFQSRKKRLLRGARYANGTLFSKTTINLSITHVVRGRLARRYK